jgi:hypothetical protein
LVLRRKNVKWFLGIFELKIQFFVFLDKRLVFIFQFLIVVSFVQLLEQSCDLLGSILEPGCFADFREQVVNLDYCVESLFNLL